MSKKTSFTLFSILASAVLVGCASKPVEEPKSTSVDEAVFNRIASSAERASISMQRLAAIRSATHGVQVTRDFKTPEGLDKPISLTWSGPVEEVAREVANLSGYSYMGAHGQKPMTPVLVSLAVKDMAAFSVLAEIGAQAGSAADVVVNPDAKRIYVKYPPVTRSGGYAAAGK